MRTLLACLLVAATPALSGCLGDATPLLGTALQRDPVSEALRTPGIHGLRMALDGGEALGLVGVPATGSSDTLVVLAKGLGSKVDDWRPLMEGLAARGALSVAMEYRGEPGTWKVEAGVEDTLAATQMMLQAHPELQRTILYGFSMGGEVAGLMAARAPPHTFTHLVVGAGVMDLSGEWRSTVSFQPLIEAAAGGRPDESPGAYAALSPLDHAAALAAQGLQRVYLVHGAADTVVPVDQAERMAQALEAEGVPVSLLVVATEPAAWVCTPLVIACAPTAVPVGAANHEAAVSATVLRVLQERVDGRPDPAAAFERTVVEGATGTSVTW
ncbi:MAG TPA: alpha/beta fold hydrolase [Candidatus Thermoplasmatota archaeon]|nr:alpha/beta fold hydrolase [Candidatus Thermoplasmatota archaeon]